MEDEVAEEVQKRVNAGEKGGILWLGLDVSAPQGLGYLAAYEHILGRHGTECDCKPERFVIGYVRRSIDAEEKLAISAWTRRTLRATRAGSMVPLAIAWDTDSRGWQFVKGREGFAAAVGALRALEDVRALVVSDLTRFARCMRCGTQVAWLLRDDGKLLGYGDDFDDRILLKDVRIPRDYAEVTRALATAENENTKRGKSVTEVFEAYHRKGLARQQRMTAFYATRRLSPTETVQRTVKGEPPWAFEKHADADEFAKGLLTQMRGKPTLETLRALVRGRRAVAPGLSIDRLVEEVNDDLVTGWESDGIARLQHLAVYTRPQVQELRRLVGAALLMRKPRRKPKRTQLIEEHGRDVIDEAEKVSEGPVCRRQMPHGGICGFPTRLRVASDPHHGGRDIRICTRPKDAHTTLYPGHHMNQLLKNRQRPAQEEAHPSRIGASPPIEPTLRVPAQSKLPGVPASFEAG